MVFVNFKWITMSPLSQRCGGMLVYSCPLVCPQQTRDADPMLDQILDHRRRRWPSIKPALAQRLLFAGSHSVLWVLCADVVQMLYKGFVLAGNSSWFSLANAGRYSFSPSHYSMLPVPACWRYGHLHAGGTGTMLWTKAEFMLARHLWRWPTFSVAPKTIPWPNTGLMVGQRRRRWANFCP